MSDSVDNRPGCGVFVTRPESRTRVDEKGAVKAAGVTAEKVAVSPGTHGMTEVTIDISRNSFPIHVVEIPPGFDSWGSIG